MHFPLDVDATTRMLAIVMDDLGRISITRTEYISMKMNFFPYFQDVFGYLPTKSYDQVKTCLMLVTAYDDVDMVLVEMTNVINH